MARRKKEKPKRKYYYREPPNRERYFYLGILAAIIILILAVAATDTIGVEDPEPAIANNTAEREATTIIGSSESYMSGSNWTTYDRYKYDGDRSPPPISSPPSPDPPPQQKKCRNHDCREYREKQYKHNRVGCRKYYRDSGCREEYYRDTEYKPCLDRCDKEPYLTRNREVLGWGEKIYLRALHDRDRPAVVEKKRREPETNDCDWWNTGYRRLAEAGWHGSDEFECWQ